MMVRITVEKPNRKAEVVTLESAAEFTVGRSADCDCCLDFDPMVSRTHAVFLVDPPSVRIKDLNSTNGLVINGEAYGAINNQRLIQPLELREGDEVFIGMTRFTVGTDAPGLDPGPEFLKIKAEQDAAQGSPDETPSSGRFIPNMGSASVSDTWQSAGRNRRSFDTVADLAAVCPDIPGYHVDKFLAAGRAGGIYKARAADGGAVVLKVASPRGALTRKLVDDFRAEMGELRDLAAHPNMAKMLNAGAVGLSTLYTASEFVSGENLASYLGRCPGNRLPPHIAFDLFMQLAEAVGHLHGRGIVHRDIHPGGIILFDDGGKLRAKFTEMGLSRFWVARGLAERALPLGDRGRLASTAPEELAQPGDSKASSDVFSLGSVFYQMLAGRFPYEFGDDFSVTRAVEEGRMRPVDESAPGLPETIVVIVDRALAFDPEMRYHSACELLEALENVSL